MTASIEATDTEAVLQLEHRRLAAINSGDGDALESTLYGDYVHVHADGNIDDRAGFIAGILTSPRTVERGPVKVRLYGDVAILIGEQINLRDENVMVGTMQQVALKCDEGWRFLSAQMTRRG